MSDQTESFPVLPQTQLDPLPHRMPLPDPLLSSPADLPPPAAHTHTCHCASLTSKLSEHVAQIRSLEYLLQFTRNRFWLLQRPDLTPGGEDVFYLYICLLVVSDTIAFILSTSLMNLILESQRKP